MLQRSPQMSQVGPQPPGTARFFFRQPRGPRCGRGRAPSASLRRLHPGKAAMCLCAQTWEQTHHYELPPCVIAQQPSGRAPPREQGGIFGTEAGTRVGRDEEAAGRCTRAGAGCGRVNAVSLCSAVGMEGGEGEEVESFLAEIPSFLPSCPQISGGGRHGKGCGWAGLRACSGERRIGAALPPPPHPAAVPAGQQVGHPPGTHISLPELWFCRCLPRFVVLSRSSRPAGEARAGAPVSERRVPGRGDCRQQPFGALEGKKERGASEPEAARCWLEADPLCGFDSVPLLIF